MENNIQQKIVARYWKEVEKLKSKNYQYPASQWIQKGSVFVTTDLVIMSVINSKLSVLLIERNEDPYKGSWALPGGFLDPNESAIEGAMRELKEETNLDNIFVEQLYTFTGLCRDPRTERSDIPVRIVTIAHYALIDYKMAENMKAGSDANQAKWVSIDDLPELAFDHQLILEKALDRVRGKISYSNIGFELVDKKEFTIPELQQIIESVIGEKLNRSNFRTKILSLEILELTGKTKQDSVGKPAPYYRLNIEKLHSLKGRSLF